MSKTYNAKPATEHTPEPWTYDTGFIVAPDPTGKHPDIYIAEIAGEDEEGRIAPYEQHEANALRICAAVYACKGIGTEALEGDAIARSRHALGELLTAAGDLDAAIDGVTEEFDAERDRLNNAIRAAQAILDSGIGLSLHELMAMRRQIALIWTVEDVQQVRPDLTDEQAWEVLQKVDRRHDAELGVNWLTLEITAEGLFGPARDADVEE